MNSVLSLGDRRSPGDSKCSLSGHRVESEEGFDVQAFIAQVPIKRFNIAIVDRLSRTDELHVYTVLVAPGDPDFLYVVMREPGLVAPEIARRIEAIKMAIVVRRA